MLFSVLVVLFVFTSFFEFVVLVILELYTLFFFAFIVVFASTVLFLLFLFDVSAFIIVINSIMPIPHIAILLPFLSVFCFPCFIVVVLIIYLYWKFVKFWKIFFSNLLHNKTYKAVFACIIILYIRKNCITSLYRKNNYSFSYNYFINFVYFVIYLINFYINNMLYNY